MVSIASWEYPTNFIVLQTNSKLNVYPRILGRPWLVTINAYFSFRVGNMTITNGKSQKKLVLYPPSKPLIEEEILMWVGQEEEEETFQTKIHTLLTIETILAMKNIDEDTFISKFIKNLYSISMKIEGFNAQ